MTSLLSPADQESSEKQMTRTQALARYARTICISTPAKYSQIRLRAAASTRTAPTVAQRIMLRSGRAVRRTRLARSLEPLDRRRFSDRVVGEELLAGRLTLLNRSEDRSAGAIWARPDLPQLWAIPR